MRAMLLAHAAAACLESWLIAVLCGWAYRAWFDFTLIARPWVPPARVALVAILAVLIVATHAWIAHRQSQA
jgi:hypothetical protein